MDDLGWLKLSMLASGITVTPELRNAALSREGVALRRNFYNSPGQSSMAPGMPQEIDLGGHVVAINDYGNHDWTMTLDALGEPVLRHAAGFETGARFLSTPASFFASDVFTSANLYGGHSLAFFSPRSCYFFSHGTQCSFCSLAGTADTNDDLAAYLKPGTVAAVTERVVGEDVDRVIDQIMIVGGNMRDLDRGFEHHVTLASAAHGAINVLGRDEISIHIATMPPKDIGRIAQLEEVPGIHVMFNLEVWDPKRFQEVCLGKERDYGRANMLVALERLSETLDPFHAHSALLCGLESSETAIEGIGVLAEMGVSAVLNVYHSDEHSTLGLGARPSFGHLQEIATGAQVLVDRYPVRPYWRTSGRNAINAELSAGLFRSPPPAFLATR